MIRKTLLSLFLIALTTAAAAQTPPTDQEQALLKQLRDTAKRQGMVLTPEMETIALQRMREMQANLLGMQMAAQAMKHPASEPVSSTVETQPAAVPLTATIAPTVSGPTPAAAGAGDWLAAIARHKAHARQTNFEDSKDGFLANGQLWLDPEGEIQRYGADRATGNVTYLVRQDDTNFVVRFANVNAPDAPVTVGQVQTESDRQVYRGVDGTQLGGEHVIPLADGLLATRGANLFRYEFGQAPTSRSLPENYDIVYAQRGDVASTGYVLAVKKGKRGFLDALGAATPTDVDHDGRITELDTKLPTLFGKRKPDFALIDSRSGQLVEVPRSEVTTHFDWNHRYRSDGRRNTQHFFNAIDWQQTSMGPVAIVFADDGSSIYAIQLETGQQVTLFKRGLGINDWQATPTADGGLRVEAQLGFKHESVEDVRTNFAAGQ